MWYRLDASVAECNVVNGATNVFDSDTVITGFDEPPPHVASAFFVRAHRHCFGIFTPLPNAKKIFESQPIPLCRAVSFSMFPLFGEENAKIVTKSGEVELFKLVHRFVPSNKFLLVFRFHSGFTLSVAIARQGRKDMRLLSILADGTYECHSQLLFYLLSHSPYHGQIQFLRLPLESLGRNAVLRSY